MCTVCVYVCGCAERQTSEHGMSISTKGANKTQRQRTSSAEMKMAGSGSICICVCISLSDCLSNEMPQCDENGQTASCI